MLVVPNQADSALEFWQKLLGQGGSSAIQAQTEQLLSSCIKTGGADVFTSQARALQVLTGSAKQGPCQRLQTAGHRALDLSVLRDSKPRDLTRSVITDLHGKKDSSANGLNIAQLRSWRGDSPSKEEKEQIDRMCRSFRRFLEDIYCNESVTIARPSNLNRRERFVFTSKREAEDFFKKMWTRPPPKSIPTQEEKTLREIFLAKIAHIKEEFTFSENPVPFTEYLSDVLRRSGKKQLSQ